MDEILELQRQLAEVQLGSTASRLSERNCVEMIMKLQSQNLIDLIFTRSGKEYLTHKQLSEEIEDEILTRGGRVNVIDLPEVLNVDLTHIQAKLPGVLENSNGEARLVRGEVVTNYYLSSLAEEVNDHLCSSETGIDTIGSVATRYNLPVEIVAGALTAHQGAEFTSIYEVDTGVLRSQASLERAKAAARGAIFGMSCPTSIQDVADRLNIPLPVVLETVTYMLESREIVGAIEGRGSRAVFTPGVFSAAAVKTATSLFTSTGFLTFAKLHQIGITDPASFSKTLEENAVLLASCVVGSTLLSTFKVTIEESNAAGSWVDIYSALPPDFPEDDAALFICHLTRNDKTEAKAKSARKTSVAKSKTSKGAEKRMQQQKEAVDLTSFTTEANVFGDHFIVSSDLICRCHGAVVADAKEKAAKRAREIEEKLSTTNSVSSSKSSVHLNGRSATEDQIESGPARKTKGKGRRRASGKPQSSEITDVTPGSNSISASGIPVSVPSMEEVIDIILNAESLQEVLESDYMGNSGLETEMVSAVVQTLFKDNKLDVVYHEKAQEAVAELERQEKEAQQLFEKNLLSSLEKIQIFESSAETLPSDSLIETSKVYIRNTICYFVVSSLLNNMAKNIGISGTVVDDIDATAQSDKPEKVREGLRKFPADIVQKLQPLVSNATGKSAPELSEFLSAYDHCAVALDMPLRRPADKKRERSIFSTIRAELVEELEKISALSGERALLICSVLLHARMSNGSIVAIPDDCAPQLSELLEETGRPAEAGAALRELREAVAQDAVETSDKSQGVILSETSLQKLEFVRGYVG